MALIGLSCACKHTEWYSGRNLIESSDRAFLRVCRKALMPLLHQNGGVEGPRKIFCDVDPKELKAGHTLHLSTADMERCVCPAPGSPEVHNDLLGLLGVKYLIPICYFVLISDQAHHRGVICKLDYGIGAINRGAVVSEEREEQRPQHTTLRHASVQEERLPHLTAWGLLVRKSIIQLQSELLMPSWLSLEISLEGITVVNAELKSINSILTYVLGLSRWVSARWSTVEIASSGDTGPVKAGWGRQDFKCERTSLSKHHCNDGCQCNRAGIVQFPAVECLGTGTMVADLKLRGTVDWARDILKMSVKTPAYCSAQARSTRPDTPSGPAAFRAFTLLRMSHTSEVEDWSESGETADVKAASLFSRSKQV